MEEDSGDEVLSLEDEFAFPLWAQDASIAAAVNNKMRDFFFITALIIQG